MSETPPQRTTPDARHTGEPQRVAPANQMNAAPSLIQQTRQIDGRRAAANDRDTPAGKRSKITIVEAVRNILGPEAR